MKKLTILFTCFLTLGITMSSFTKIDLAEASIVGKWKYYQEGEKISKAEFLYPYEHQERCGKDYVEFFDDGKVNDVFYYGTENCEISVDSGIWKKEANNLTINFPLTGEEKAEILLLDATTLKVKTKFEDKEIIHIYKKI